MTNLKELERKAMEALDELVWAASAFDCRTDGEKRLEEVQAYISALKAETEKVAREAWEAAENKQHRYASRTETFDGWWEKRKG